MSSIGGKYDIAKAMSILGTVVEDPILEGPRALQEYWCAKVVAAVRDHRILKVSGAKWANLSTKHNEMIDNLLAANSLWYGGLVSTEMRAVLAQVAASTGPLLTTWIRSVRSDSMEPTTNAWTTAEAQLVLKAIILQAWRDAVPPSSPMYSNVASAVDRESTATSLSIWPKLLMVHVKQQFVKFSKETIKRVLQDRASLDRETIVQEFESIKDDYERAAQLMMKQFRIGRWAIGTNFQKYDADLFDFETEQRHRMGLVAAPVYPIYLAGSGAKPATAEDYGFNLSAAPEDGYDMNQGADGDDY